MKINLASHLGMCFGVRDAIKIARDANRVAPVTILGDLVHNETVVNDLRQDGIDFQPTAESVRTNSVMITAHGASDRCKDGLRARGLEVLEATCPLVQHAHRAVQSLLRDGYHPVVIGQRGHVEVRGLTEDLPACDIVLSEEDIAKLEEWPRLGVAAQTTQPIDKVLRLLECIKARFPKSEVRFIDTVCQPTKQRQSAAIELAQRSDVVVVIGGAHSNNTRELVTTCERHCQRVHLVHDATGLRSIWFQPDDRVGVTAGTSTPDKTITAVMAWLEEFSEFQNRLQEQMHCSAGR